MATSLSRYRKKRQFKISPEPAGKVIRRKGFSYVVQKHDASHLHYDFRLELDGVLKSWAVPKGPSLDPNVKRLAVEVEDHPVDYGDFEGIIPKGQYGGGTVMLWDRGNWTPVGDPHDGIRLGRLKFQLQGYKLHGTWMLVRIKSTQSSQKPQWLLVKEQDEEAIEAQKGDVLEEFPLSVQSGRDLAEIAAGTKVHHSNRSAGAKERTLSPGVRSTRKGAASNSTSIPANAPRKPADKESMNTILGGKKASMPKVIDVQLATLTAEPPEGDEWLHEIKLDGYRMICRKNGDKIQFISRNRQDWTRRLDSMLDAVKKIPVDQVILDGEVVALKPDGSSSFQMLQNAFRDSRSTDLTYFAFDLLYLNGLSLIGVPLERRKEDLAKLIATTDSNATIRYSDHLVGLGTDFQREACRMHLEGIISKRRDRPYQSGRGTDWLKIKCVKTEEFVIGGYTEPSGNRSGFGALLVGFQDAKGQLKYAGKVGTGFSEVDLKELTKRFKALERKTSPFVDLQRKSGPTRTAHWVEPELVGQFKYASRTDDNRLRHASFEGLREDKPAQEVTLEKPMSVKAVVHEARRKSEQTGSARQRKGGDSTSASAVSNTKESPSQEFAGVRLTNPDKVLFPEGSITKRDLAHYYEQVADWILPHLVHRPVVLVRCPEGLKQACFYQKHPGVGTPDVLRHIPIREKQKTEEYVVVDNVKGLVALTQISALEIHAWGSREDKLEFPDRLIFDLDPAPDVPWKTVVDGARQIRQLLQELGLESFVKTTGGKGLHIVLPVDRRNDWDQVKSFCKLVADTIVAADPKHYTANMSKAARPGKIFIDYLRNGRGATAVVPYSTRSRPGATVSMPLAWKELTPRITSGHYTIKNVAQRLSSLKNDPWEKMSTTRQSLSEPWKKLKSLSPID